MPLPTPPVTLMLQAVLDTIRQIDWFGLYGVDPVMRHMGETLATAEERAQIAILVRFDTLDADEGDVQGTVGVAGELRMVLGCSLVIDADLETVVSEQDPTRVARLAAVAGICMAALKDLEGLMPQRGAWEVDEAGMGLDDQSSEDAARMAQHLNVIYRTLDRDPMTLLMEGQDA